MGNIRGTHYDHGTCTTVEFVERVVNRLEDVTAAEAWMIGNALKYACRAGFKDPDWTKDADKCADYIQRFKTGGWVDDGE